MCCPKWRTSIDPLTFNREKLQKIKVFGCVRAVYDIIYVNILRAFTEAKQNIINTKRYKFPIYMILSIPYVRVGEFPVCETWE
jgi:hypothetical protein